jgi:hypothetical protein
MKAYSGSRVILPFILNFGEQQCGTYSTITWVGSRAGVDVLEMIKKSPAPTEIRTQNHPARGLVTVPAPNFYNNLCYSYRPFWYIRYFLTNTTH